MITNSYHSERESIISPGAFLGERKNICETAITTFSYEIVKAVIGKYPHVKIAETGSANGYKPIYLLDINGRKIIFYMSNMGSCLAGNDIIEIEWLTGIKKLIMFGSAGSLDNEVTKGKYVIPTQAYRDEGMSYHYAPAADFIDITNHEKLAEIFEKLSLPYVKGRVWTTDAPYRETKSALNTRTEQGCIAVEMELAGVQAVCSYYGIELYDFVVTGDILDGKEYEHDGLDSANHSIDKFLIALKIAEHIQ